MPYASPVCHVRYNRNTLGVSISARILRQEHRVYPLAVRWFAEGRVRQVHEQVEVTGVPPGATLLFSNEP